MNRIRIKLLAAVLCGGLLGGLCMFACTVYSRMMMDLKTTCVAVRDIPPRTRIERSDLTEIRVPQAYLAAGTVNDPEQIIGRYTEIQGMIPAGSPFYQCMLHEESELPDYPASQLRQGQAAYSLETDLLGAGGMIAGQRADLYLTVEPVNESPVTGCLFENVRIISIRDHQGVEISDERSTGIPYLAVLAVSQKDVEILSVADKVGSIRMIASSSSYDVSEEARLAADETLKSYLRTQEETE
ncbi:MAG: hypothetical protein E7190_12225 [Erysipelotrichaceae bacterium]|nr:hypothetical protein [Erysipelotrichaceae bacterium]